MKIKKYSNDKIVYCERFNGAEMIANVFDDNSGYFVISKKNKEIYLREDATPKHWLADIELKIKQYNAAKNFLEKLIENQNKEKLAKKPAEKKRIKAIKKVDKPVEVKK
jgi:hypothetical protein